MTAANDSHHTALDDAHLSPASSPPDFQALLGSGAISPLNVYAIGQVRPAFPSEGVEKELLQAATPATGPVDGRMVKDILSNPSNRYLMRQMCWIFSVQGLDAYVLEPAEATDLELLRDAIGHDPHEEAYSVVIGSIYPSASVGGCATPGLPSVRFDQLYTFHLGEFVAAIPKPDDLNIEHDEFGQLVRYGFWRLVTHDSNAGASDEHRPRNYLALGYLKIYEM